MGSQQALFDEGTAAALGLTAGSQGLPVEAQLDAHFDAMRGHQLDRPMGQLFDEVPPDWQPLTAAFRTSPLGTALITKVEAVRQAGDAIFPQDVFAALRLTRRAQIKVVILGQDPYHGQGQAHGLAFSVRPGVAIPPSLRNIRKEILRDLGLTPPVHG